MSLLLLSLLLVSASRAVLRNAASLWLSYGYWVEDSYTTWRQAERFQTYLLSLQPEFESEDHIRLARILVVLGKIEEANRIWEIAGRPISPFFLLEMGDSLWNLGEETKALASWQLVPDLDIYFGQKALHSSETGDAEDALKKYNISWMINSRASPQKGGFLLDYCQKLRAQGEISQAIIVCKRAVESGNTFGANLALGILHFDQRDFGNAETYFRRAHRLNPENARANLWLGLALSNQGRLVEAIDYYRQGLELAPKDGWLNYLMGKALWDSAQPTSARQYIEKSIEHVPNSWEAAYLQDALRLMDMLQP